MFSIRRLAPLALIWTFGLGGAAALDLGDKAPALRIKQWVKGDAVDLAAGVGKNIYVIEFWATWCPPCRASIPHLTELQNKYKDKGVVVIGVSSDDTDALNKVPAFVKEWDKKIGYTIAIDDEKRTKSALLEPFAAPGIPWAFIVDRDGKIVWAGNPRGGLEEALEQVVAGKYDIEPARKAEAKRREEAKASEQVFKLLDEYTDLVTSSKADEKSRALGQQIYKSSENLPELLNGLSWFILTDPRIVERDLPLAMKAAERANTLTENNAPAIIDTYARALFDTGKVEEAIKAEERALQLCKDHEMKKDFVAALERYRAAKK